MVLQGHGVYAWGRTPDEALFRIEALEFLCQLRSLNR
ncbi:MAG: class II aldolase/adducin family protein [Bdellovibrionota bacterium]